MIDLQPYCSDDLERPYLRGPFTIGEWTYATNGHIAVRVPKRDGVGTPKNVAPADKIFAKADFALYEFSPFTETTLGDVTTVDCRFCDGHGHGIHDCPTCECVCSRCVGTGQLSSDDYQNEIVRGVYFARRYIRQLLALPGVQIATKPVEAEPMCFKFDGGEGVLMPLLKPYD